MRIYVAGKAGDDAAPLVPRLMDDLEEHGHTITLRWPEIEVQKPYREHAENVGIAEQMSRAVKQADLLILVGGLSIFGAMAEFGIAIGNNIPVLVIGRAAMRDSIFFQHPGVRVISLEELDSMIVNDQWPIRRPQANAMRCG